MALEVVGQPGYPESEVFDLKTARRRLQSVEPTSVSPNSSPEDSFSHLAVGPIPKKVLPFRPKSPETPPPSTRREQIIPGGPIRPQNKVQEVYHTALQPLLARQIQDIASRRREGPTNAEIQSLPTESTHITPRGYKEPLPEDRARADQLRQDLIERTPIATKPSLPPRGEPIRPSHIAKELDWSLREAQFDKQAATRETRWREHRENAKIAEQNRDIHRLEEQRAQVLEVLQKDDRNLGVWFERTPQKLMLHVYGHGKELDRSTMLRYVGETDLRMIDNFMLRAAEADSKVLNEVFPILEQKKPNGQKTSRFGNLFTQASEQIQKSWLGKIIESRRDAGKEPTAKRIEIERVTTIAETAEDHAAQIAHRGREQVERKQAGFVTGLKNLINQVNETRWDWRYIPQKQQLEERLYQVIEERSDLRQTIDQLNDDLDKTSDRLKYWQDPQIFQFLRTVGIQDQNVFEKINRLEQLKGFQQQKLQSLLKKREQLDGSLRDLQTQHRAIDTRTRSIRGLPAVSEADDMFGNH